MFKYINKVPPVSQLTRGSENQGGWRRVLNIDLKNLRFSRMFFGFEKQRQVKQDLCQIKIDDWIKFE